MRNGRLWLGLLTAALGATCALQPVLAQSPFDRQQDQLDQAYRGGYRAGYDDGRTNRRYNDDDSPYLARDNDRDQRWRRRYARLFTFEDDNFYRECRGSSDPAGILAGAFIAGLSGNAAERGSAKGTTGIVLGGTAGAAVTRSMSCADRSYAYKAYYDGLTSGRVNAMYRWSNPRSGNSGDFRLGEGYIDPDGFHCASYTQRITIDGRSQSAAGRACQQPDGSWVIVS